MKKAVTAARMKEIDRLAQEKYGIPSLILMENAGRVSAEEILKDRKKVKAAIFCGKGNNGGDGFVCARYLENAGIKTKVFLMAKCNEVKNPDPLLNLGILRKMGIKVEEVTTEKALKKLKKNFSFYVIVDAIFGIGFKGTLPDLISKTADFFRSTKLHVYSLDIPSGLDATRGYISTSCVKAYKTVTFGLSKKGLLMSSAKNYTGKVVVRDIGFPRKLLK